MKDLHFIPIFCKTLSYFHNICSAESDGIHFKSLTKGVVAIFVVVNDQSEIAYPKK